MQLQPSFHVNKAFESVEDSIYYTGWRDDRKYPIEFFESFQQCLADVGEVSRFSGSGWGLSVSPDRQTLLFNSGLHNGSNLMMVEKLPITQSQFHTLLAS